MRTALEPSDVPAILTAFHLGSSGSISDGPVASGRLGSIWRLDTDTGTWAVKTVGDLPDASLAEILEGAEFQEAALRAGVPTPAVQRTRDGDVLATVGEVRVRVHAWAELLDPDPSLDPVAIGSIVAGLHRVDFRGTVGVHPWYTEPVGAARWRAAIRGLRARRAPFVDELDALLPEILANERHLGAPPRAPRTCHRDLWADNVRRTRDGGMCVFDFDNAGLADPSQELAAVLVEYAWADASRAAAVVAAYTDAGGPGRVDGPEDFAMAIAQLGHIVEEGCRRWLRARTDEHRADNEGWIREFIDRPLTPSVVQLLLDGVRAAAA